VSTLSRWKGECLHDYKSHPGSHAQPDGEGKGGTKDSTRGCHEDDWESLSTWGIAIGYETSYGVWFVLLVLECVP
jgi:hypothetical protein